MRRRRVLLLLLLTLAITTIIVVYLRLQRPARTIFNWRAHVNTVAGDGSPTFLDVPEATRAGFSDPFGVAIAPDGTIYISDAGESNRIRKLTSDGRLVTIAGGHEGFVDGAPASFNTPSGLALDVDGNIYVADTSNNRIRKVTPEGVLSTVAGSGMAGYVDGPAASAQFDGPIGIAVDSKKNIYVGDTYNDRIRKISADGQVTTFAGVGRPGYADGDAANASFDSPCGVVVSFDGTVIVADSGNNKLRKIAPTGQVTTLPIVFDGEPGRTWLRTPLGLASTHDGFLYVTEFDRASIVQIAPDGKACVLAGNGPGYADGFAVDARFNQPAGVAVDPRNGDLVVADGANYLVRRLSRTDSFSTVQAATEVLPLLTPETLGEKNLLWPLDPQHSAHEVVATMGEVRGSFDSTDNRDHLHSGLDVAGAYGDVVRAIRSEKVTSPLPNWGFGELSEGMRVAVISYIHIQVGRDKDGQVFSDPRFIPVNRDDGKLAHVRVRRGTRFRPGDAIGTVNRMYHVHLVVGPSGGVINPLSLSPIGFKDTITPTIETEGVQLFDEGGTRLTKTQDSRLIVHGRLRIVVDAFDRTDSNSDRRRLGLYSLGYQVFKDSPDALGNPERKSRSNAATATATAPGFASPRVTVIFNRLPADDHAAKLAYAQESGITVYGNKTTRFLYDITNTVRDGHSRAGLWDTSELPNGDYVLRIIAADYSGNEAHRDVLIRIN